MFGPYRLEGLIGAGGTGEVYQAELTESDDIVAIKRRTARRDGDASLSSRFHRELEVVAQLDNPHVIPVYEFGELDELLFAEMPLIDGVSLADLIARNGGLPPERVVPLISQVAQALDAAHDRGIVHRDVKPSNVLIAELGNQHDHAYLIDFSLTRATFGEGPTSVDDRGVPTTTLRYAAPERFLRGRDLDHRIDVYALGCVLYEALTGEVPFQGEELAELRQAHVNDEVPRPSELVGGPSGFDDVVARAMAKDPDDRYASAGELADAAEAVLATVTTSVIPAVVDDEPAELKTAETTEDRVEEPAMAGAVAPPRTRGATSSGPAPRSAPDDTRSSVRAPEEVTPRRGGAPPRSTGATASPTSPLPPPSVPPPPAMQAEGPAPSRRTDEDTGPLPAHPEKSERGASPGVWVAVGAVVLGLFGLVVFMLGHDSGSSTVVAAPPLPPVASGPATSVPNTIIGVFPAGQGPNAVAVNRDGSRTYLADTDSNSLTEFDTANRRVLATIPVDKHPVAVAVTPDGSKVLVVNQWSNTVSVVDAAGNSAVSTIKVEGSPADVAIAPDGKHAYVANTGAGSVSVIDTTGNAVIGTIKVLGDPAGLALDKDGGRLYVACQGANSVAVVDTTNNTVTAKIAVGDQPDAVAVTPDGARAYVANYGANSVTVFDTASNGVVATVPVNQNPEAITLTPDGGRAYLTSAISDSLAVIDTSNNTVLTTISLARHPAGVAISPDGRLGYVPNNVSGSVTVLDVAPR